jgi:multicomponent Na+:H+ antiporter subunit D
MIALAGRVLLADGLTQAAVALPVVVPLLTGIICLLAWRSLRWQRRISVAGAALLLLASLVLAWRVHRLGIQVSQMGGWQAPFGITLVADYLSAIMLATAAAVAFTGVVYSLGSIGPQRQAMAYHPVLHLLFMGVNGALLTGDIFNLYVWIELMLVCSFVLLVMGGGRAQFEGGIKYVAMNMLGSMLFLAAVALTYSTAGSLNMAHLARVFAEGTGQGLPLGILAMLFLVALGIKSAVFPLFFWLPASYHTAPVAVMAIFSGLLTKVGIYALVRLFTLLFGSTMAWSGNLMLIIAGLTMVTGVLGAVAQNDLRRLLSFHIVSQIGYMLMGLALFTAMSLAGTLYFLVHIMVTKTALFLVGGMVYRVTETYDLYRMGDLYRRRPLLACLFLIPALSLSGIPPLSGFIGKLALVWAGLEVGAYIMVAVALAVSVLTLFSMTKIWTEAFWKPVPGGQDPPGEKRPDDPSLAAPTLLLGALTVVLGLAAGPLFRLMLRAGEQMLDPQIYIRAVLGGGA